MLPHRGAASRFKCAPMLSARVGRPPPPSPAARASPFLLPPVRRVPSLRAQGAMCSWGQGVGGSFGPLRPLGLGSFGGLLPPLCRRRASPPSSGCLLLPFVAPGWRAVPSGRGAFATCCARGRLSRLLALSRAV